MVTNVGLSGMAGRYDTDDNGAIDQGRGHRGGRRLLQWRHQQGRGDSGRPGLLRRLIRRSRAWGPGEAEARECIDHESVGVVGGCRGGPMAGGAAARCSRGGVVAPGRQVLLRVVGAPGRAVGGDDHALWVWRSRSGRGDAALRVQLRTFQPVCVPGCRRRPDRHLHPAGREQLSVYRDGPKRGGLLHVLRGHKGCEQSGGIGLRRFHDTGWPAANAHADTNTDPNAYTHANAHTNTLAHTDTLGRGTGRGGKHASTGDRPADFRGSPTCDRCRGVSP